MVLMPHHRMRLGWATLPPLILVLGGCGAIRSEPQIHAHGCVAGQLVNTRVDSPLAEYYIEDYLTGDPSKAEFDTELRQIEDQLGPGVPDRETLAWVTNCYSRDVATILLAERLTSDSLNQQFTAAYRQQLELVTRGSIDPAESTHLKSDVVFLIVPGWYWHDQSFDGALEGPREYLEQFGYHAELLATDDKASVEQNAELVARQLRALRRAGKLVVLVSASKGGAETALALGQLVSWEESSHVLAWINVNGAVRGSPLADELLNWRRNLVTRLSLWLAYGDNAAGLRSMRTGHRRRVFESLQFPPHLLIVNFTAVPLSGHVTPRSRGYDRLLDEYGPHDGSVLISDELINNVPTVTELGFDHYFFDPMIGVKALALVRVLEESLQPAGSLTMTNTNRHE